MTEEKVEEKRFAHIYKRIKMVTWLPFLFTLTWIIDFSIIPPQKYEETVLSQESYVSRGRRSSTTHYLTYTQHFKIRYLYVYHDLKPGDSVFVLGTPIFKDIKDLHYKNHDFDIDYQSYVKNNLQEDFMLFVWFELVLCVMSVFVCKPGINSATFSAFAFVLVVPILLFAFY